MKLRIRGNSVRLRLGRSEVQCLAAQGALDESTQFDSSGKHRLGYRIEASNDVSSVHADFDSGQLLVRVPSDAVRRWASSEQVGIEASQAIGPAGHLKILIEKDFECIDGPPDEPQDDAFPHPGNRAACAPGDEQAPA